MSLREIIQELPKLSVEERKQLVLYIMDSFTVEKPEKKHNILEFEGAAAHLYDGTDAQDYINELRRE